MFGTHFTTIKSAAAAAAWLDAVVTASGGPSIPLDADERADCEEIVRHFANRGVTITVDQANTFWNEYSASQQAGWLVLSNDCVAALDALVEDIAAGQCKASHLQVLRGRVSAF